MRGAISIPATSTSQPSNYSTPVVSRLRLLRRMRELLRTDHVIVVAPAGYGKTTLLRNLAAHRPNTYYLNLTLTDTDTVTLQQRITPLLQPEHTLILDDIHLLVEAPESLDWLADLIRKAQPRLVLAGRYLPQALPGASLGLIGINDLCFTAAEALSLVGNGLPADEVATWHTRTAGWPMALALLTWGGTTALAKREAEAGQELIDELVHSIVAKLPPDLQHFLTLTAAPLRFTLSLANYLCDQPVEALLAETVRLNLFIEPDGEAGWFRYHPLVRPALQSHANLRDTQARAVNWLVEAGETFHAIDIALNAGLLEQAATLLEIIAATRFASATGRYRTFQRWVLALGEPMLSDHPLLLLELGSAFGLDLGLKNEAWRYLNLGLRFAESLDTLVQVHARLQVAAMYAIGESNADEALKLCLPVLEQPDLPAGIRRKALKTASNAYYARNEYQHVARLLRQALALPEEPDGPTNLDLRQNLVVQALLPRGDFAAAVALMHNNQTDTDNSLNSSIWYKLTLAWLHEAMGDWESLEHTISAGLALEARAEQPDLDPGGWPILQVLLQIGRGNLAEGERQLAAIRSGLNGEMEVYGRLYEVWLARRKGESNKAVALADTALTHYQKQPLPYAVLLLERELARFEAGQLATTVPAELMILARLRARPQLLRLRALLTLLCYQQHDANWQKHMAAAVRSSRRYGYNRILTSRDPELGSRFWALVLAEGIATEQALLALQQIGDPRPLVALLYHPTGAARTRVAQGIVAIGAEQSMRPLAEALVAERDPIVSMSFQSALDKMEQQPPAPITIQLMGEFRVWRNGVVLPTSAWVRPIVQRLLHYFALHRGQPITRDKILDDLWPESDPESAAASFRTIYSRVNAALDPYLRARAASRYFAVADNVYTFDPYQRVQVDIEQFTLAVEPLLQTAEQHDLPPLPEAFLTALRTYRPLLPQVPYAEWLLEPREQLTTLYANGCHYAADALLLRNAPADALLWAERATDTAPWLEEAYQSRMRAHARLNQRSQALKVYAEAVSALQRELNATPARLTSWLAERVQRDEEI